MASTLKKMLSTGAFAAVLATTGSFVGLSASAQGPEAPRFKTAVSELTLICAGYVAPNPAPEDIQIVGADREALSSELAQGDSVFLNKGRGSNLQVGAEYLIVRNIGPVKDVKDKKKVIGNLVREFGILRITAVQDNSATGEIKVSCDAVHLGDAVVPYEKRASLPLRPYKPLSLVGAPTGRTSGQILGANLSREQLGPNDIVYLNVGVDSGVKVGDYMTIYRQLGSDTVVKFRDDKVGPKRSNGFPSHRFDTRNNASITSSSKGRPQVLEQVPRNTLPRTLVGEVLVVRSEGNTATAIITRVNREAFIGDYVELQ